MGEASDRGYVFQDRGEEERRLIAQPGLFAPSTEREGAVIGPPLVAVWARVPG